MKAKGSLIFTESEVKSALLLYAVHPGFMNMDELNSIKEIDLSLINGNVSVSREFTDIRMNYLK
jgi:hypothetical protein